MNPKEKSRYSFRHLLADAMDKVNEHNKTKYTKTIYKDNSGTYEVTLPEGFKLQNGAVVFNNAEHTPKFKRVGESVEVTIGKPGCQHTFQDYHGFRESYKFCTKCDHKEDF